MNTHLQKTSIGANNSKLLLRTDGRNLEVAASGIAANLLAATACACLLALTINVIRKS